MAHTKTLEANRLEEVRAYLGAFLNTHSNSGFTRGAAFVEESFEIYTLSSGKIASNDPRATIISDLLIRTGTWHHQISQNGVAVGFAISGHSAKLDNSWMLHGVFAAPLAQRIASAIRKIDAERPQEDIEVFLFSVPAYQLKCFLLRGYLSEEVFVIQNPYTAPPIEGKIYSAREFLLALKQRSHINGLSF